MNAKHAPCAGTRLPVIQWRKPVTDLPPYGTYARRYGIGRCSVCGASVVCHKDRSAVYHRAKAEGREP